MLKIKLAAAVVASAGFVLVAGSALAAPEPKDPARQTSWRLYVDSKEAFAMKQAQGDKVVLIDVRDPAEIQFTGFAPAVDAVVPFLRINTKKWNETKSIYLMEKNPQFEAKIAKVLGDRGLTKDTPVLLMCRSGGERGAPSAKELEGKGYSKVFVVVDGFEGDTVRDGERKNWRLVDGWKNSGLPWTYKLDNTKMPLDP